LCDGAKTRTIHPLAGDVGLREGGVKEMNVLGSLAYKFTLDGAEVEWDLVEAVIDESLQELPRYTFDVTTAAALEPGLLSKALDLEISRVNNGAIEGEPELRKGVVVGVDFMHRTDVTRFRQRVRVSHKAWRLTLNRRRRIFAGPIKASDIISSILQEHGLNATVDASRRTREVITQFDESDYDFVRRLCEDEGFTLIFAHDNANKVLAKDLTAGTSLPSLGTSLYAPPHQALTLGEPCVQQFTRELRASTAGVKAVEWDIKTAAALQGLGHGAGELHRRHQGDHRAHRGARRRGRLPPRAGRRERRGQPLLSEPQPGGRPAPGRGQPDQVSGGRRRRARRPLRRGRGREVPAHAGAPPPDPHPPRGLRGDGPRLRERLRVCPRGAPAPPHPGGPTPAGGHAPGRGGEEVPEAPSPATSGSRCR
jgi:hypothetical protein